jgi:hypothetical protein
LQENPHPAVVHVGVALAGGAHGVQLAPHVRVDELLSQTPLQL